MYQVWMVLCNREAEVFCVQSRQLRDTYCRLFRQVVWSAVSRVMSQHISACG